MTSCLAVIPARGGSKGIPGKNLRPVGGRPLLGRAIDAALGAGAIDRVVVSTDDAAIARTARECGAEVVERPADLSGDTASSEAAVLHCLDALRSTGQPDPELVMLIQCTSPLTTAADLDGAIATLRAAGADSCFTAVPFHHFLWETAADGSAVGINHSGSKRQRRQDLAPQLLENGAAYVMRTAAFRAAGDRFCGQVVAHVMPAERCLEIDEPADLVVAEALVRHGESAARAHALPDPIDAVIFDFDGVFTDNRVLVGDDGREAVLCDRGDGMGISLLRSTKIPLLILSKEQNPVVARRADKLRLECLHGIDDKPAALDAWLSERGLRWEQTIFVGNDVNDVECMGRAGCAACPADAHPSARSVADIALSAAGGRGAVRELCDLILATRAREG